LQKLFLVPSYTTDAKQLDWQFKFLSDFKWLKNYRLWLAPSLIIIWPIVHHLTMKGICSAITKYTYEERKPFPISNDKSLLQKIIQIPAEVNLALIRSLQWTVSLIPIAKRMKDPHSTTRKPFVENTANLALKSMTSLVVSVMFYPILTLTMRAQALHFVSTTGPSWLKSDIYPLLPSLSGTTSRIGLHTAANYAGKILLCYGMEGVTFAVMIQIRAAFAKHIIRKQGQLGSDNRPQ